MSLLEVAEYGFRLSAVQQIPANEVTWTCQVTYRDPLGVVRAMGIPVMGEEPPSLEEVLTIVALSAQVGAMSLPEFVDGYGCNDTVADVEDWQSCRRRWVRFQAWVWDDDMADHIIEWCNGKLSPTP